MDLSRGIRLSRTRAAWVAGQARWSLLGVFVYFRVRGLTEGSVEVAVSTRTTSSALERRSASTSRPRCRRPVAPSETLETVANWVYIWGHWPVIVGHHGLAGLAPPRRLPAPARRHAGLRRPRAWSSSHLPGGAATAGGPRPGRHGDRAVSTPTACCSRRRSSTSTPRCRACTPAGTCWSGIAIVTAASTVAAAGRRLRDAGPDGVGRRRHRQPLRPRRRRRGALVLRRARGRAAARRRAAAHAGGAEHDRPGHRPPGRQLARRAARGQRARRRRDRVRRARVPGPARGPSPEDGRAAALPVGPLGAGLGVGAAARPATSC